MKAVTIGGIALTALFLLTGCKSLSLVTTEPEQSKTAPAISSSPISTGSVVTQNIKERAIAVIPQVETISLIDAYYPMAGYSRSLFPHWLHMDAKYGWSEVYSDPCDTRQASMIQQGTDVYINGYCKILSGNWPERYGHYNSATGALEGFGKVYTNPSDVDVDHVVPLAGAWRLGASTWDNARRESLANDPNNLIVTGLSGNREKGDKLPDVWVPYDPATACEYLVRFSEVSVKYDLNMTKDLRGIVIFKLKRCTTEASPQFWEGLS